jgi:hypothetical protein
MEEGNKENKLEVTLNTDIKYFLREEKHVDGRVAGFLNILYKVGKIKTLGDISKLEDIDVFLVNQFSEISLKRLNGLLNKYKISVLEVDMKKKNLADYRRKVDLERKIITEKEGLEKGLVPSIVGGGSFDYRPNRYFSR